MENKEWLNDLKVGDKVFVVTQKYSTSYKQLRKVKRITPTRRIVVENMTFIKGEFNSNNYFGTRIYLEQVTQETLEEFYQNLFKNNVIDKIKHLQVKDITFKQAQQLNDILNLEVRTNESIEY